MHAKVYSGAAADIEEWLQSLTMPPAASPASPVIHKLGMLLDSVAGIFAFIHSQASHATTGRNIEGESNLIFQAVHKPRPR